MTGRCGGGIIIAGGGWLTRVDLVRYDQGAMTAIECAAMALAKGIASELTVARTLAWAAGVAVCELRDQVDSGWVDPKHSEWDLS